VSGTGSFTNVQKAAGKEPGLEVFSSHKEEPPAATGNSTDLHAAANQVFAPGNGPLTRIAQGASVESF